MAEKELLSFKCPSCGAPLTYDSDSSDFACSYCDSHFDFETVKNADVNAEKPFDWGDYNKNVSTEELEGTVSYVCQSCGAEIVADATTAATRCPYCDNVVLMEPNLTGFVKPNGVIPFKIDQKGLADRIKAFCKGKWLLPKNFVTANKIKEVQGVYVPFWLFDCTCDGDATYETTRVRHWSDSSYNYTETSYYYATIDGSMSFSRIPVDGSVKMDDALMDSLEPFDYSQLVEFAPGYLSGYLADRFDVNAESSLPRADARVRQSVDQVYRGQLSEFTSVMRVASNLKLTDPAVKYVLLPVYLITSKYAGKNYSFAVNGQTGKVIGSLPVSKGKFWSFLLGFSALFSAIAYLIAWWLQL